MEIFVSVVLTFLVATALWGAVIIRMKLSWQDSARRGVESFTKLLAVYAEKSIQRSTHLSESAKTEELF